MIGKTLQAILDEKGINPNELARRINVSNQTLYSIIKRDNMKIDFEILLKICSELNVDIERFYSDYLNGSNIARNLSDHEQQLIENFRSLNQEGQTKLLDYSDDLVSSNKYIKNSQPETLADHA